MAKTIRSIDGMIEALGGPTAVAEWADIVPSAVCNWVDKQSIPRGWHLPLIIEMKRRRLRFDPTVLFGLSHEQARILLRPDPVHA